MSQKLKVLILGYGEMGHAMTYLLSDRHTVDVWVRQPQDGFQSAVIDEAAAQADVVLFCLPVNPHREVTQKIMPMLKENCLCISIAKGLDDAGQTAAQVFSDVLQPEQPYALLYGPMISEEIRAGRYAFAQLGCQSLDSFNTVCELFSGTSLYIEHTFDIKGISWSVILKNVYALIFGMADELKLGDNMRGYLCVSALKELDNIACNMGGQTGSPYHLAGLGDLITTATSENSHHHALGRLLAKGNNIAKNLKGEGLHTLEMVRKYKLFNTVDYPLFQLIDNIVLKTHDVRKKIDSYLKKKMLNE